MPNNRNIVPILPSKSHSLFKARKRKLGVSFVALELMRFDEVAFILLLGTVPAGRNKK